MGGLYNMVLGDGGEDDRGNILLAILGNPDPGRYRDSWVELADNGDPVIAIYTRNGGGNRDCYCEEENDYLCTGCTGDNFEDHELCFEAIDDEFDCTYRTYRFLVPEEYKKELAKIAGDKVDPSQRWLDFFAALDATKS